MSMVKYKNPIISGFHPDPSICRVGEDYYLVTSSFEYFPGIPIFHSKDLIHWEQIGYCITRESQLKIDKAPNAGCWAPTIRYYKGKFYMTTTNHGKGNFIITATDPAGEWSEPIYIDQGGIDPSLFFDDDGKVYFTSTGNIEGKKGIVQSEIDINTGKRLSEIKFLWAGSGGQCPEGPHLYKINGHYYLMIAEGGTEYGHMETIARGDSPWGPFISCPRNPILTHRNRKGHPVQGVGHADLVQAHDGSWWAVCLGFRYTRKYFHHLGRETFLLPVTFDKEGWPIINKNGTVELEIETECLQQYHLKTDVLRDDFDEDQLKVYWNFIRNTYDVRWSLTERRGYLTLHGSELTLNDLDAPTFVGRRQQHFNCKVQTLIEFTPEQDGEEAGITLFLNNEHHYDFYIRKFEGAYQLVLRRVVGDMSYVAFTEDIETTSLILEITADPYEYKFSYGYDKETIKYLGMARTQFLSTEAGVLGFVGVYFGLYATGNGKKSSVPAYFSWFDYRIL